MAPRSSDPHAGKGDPSHKAGHLSANAANAGDRILDPRIAAGPSRVRKLGTQRPLHFGGKKKLRLLNNDDSEDEASAPGAFDLGDGEVREIDQAEFTAYSTQAATPRDHQASDILMDDDTAGSENTTPAADDFADWYPQPASVEDRKEFSQLVARIETASDLKTLYPPSLHSDYQGPSSRVTVVSEEYAFLWLARPAEETGDQHLELHDFSIYDRVQLNGKGFGGQLRSPADIFTKGMGLVIDGTIQKGEERLHVNGMNILKMEISNLVDPSTLTTLKRITIQTSDSAAKNIWYRLDTPAKEYEKIWKDFVWLADFSKFFLHFVLASSEHERRLSLRAFGQDFFDFIADHYGTELGFDAIDKWLDVCNRTTDFRKQVIRYGSFLKAMAELLNSQGYDGLFEHDFWDDINVTVGGTTNGRVQRKRRGSSPIFEKTVVTPDVGKAFLRCFPHWGPGPGRRDLFEMVHPRDTVRQKIDARRNLLGFPDKYYEQDKHFSFINGRSFARAALALQAVALEQNGARFDLDEVFGMAIIVERASAPLRQHQYAFVRDITDDGKVLVAWLLLPNTTTCGEDFYPIGNELMLSDECSCRPVDVSKIRGVYSADLCALKASAPDGFFIHGLFRSDTKEHITANHEQHVVPGCIQHDCQLEQIPQQLPGPQNCTKIGLYSLFSGCGLLDHSMCSTGYFEARMAVDMNKVALLSHKANTQQDQDCAHIHKSTNAHLKDILQAQTKYPGVDCLIAGCPCQGFSGLNNNKNSLEAHRNCSMLANLLSYIAVYLPRFGMIENVVRMDHKNKDIGDANACEVAISVLVSLGYQVSKTVVRGEDMKATTRRERLFICYAAPGLRLPKPPTADPVKPIPDAFDVLHSLDPVTNDDVHNIKMPDHVPFERLNVNFDAGVSVRNIVSRIPKDGPRRNLFGAADQGLLDPAQMRWFRTLTTEKQAKGSSSLSRVQAEGLFSTITSQIVPMNSRGMASIHPFQDRVLTLEELRRGQGVPAGFLLVGEMRDAAKQIGNGVAWEVGEGWGFSFARAAFESGMVEEVGGDVEMRGE